MKLKVQFTGTVDVSPREAALLRTVNRSTFEASLGYRMGSYMGEWFLFFGKECTLQSSVRIMDSEPVVDASRPATEALPLQ